MKGTESENQPSVFCHSAVDDAGFTSAQFRVLHRVARRDGPDGCFESMAEIAAGCRLNIRTVKTVVRQLVSVGIVGRTDVSGRPSVLRLTLEEWVKRGKPHPKEDPSPEMDPVQTEYGEGVQKRYGEGDQKEPPHPTQKEPPEGIPYKESKEGYPTKVIQSEMGDQCGGALELTSSPAVSAINPEDIYAAYPRKVARTEALAAIAKALRTVPAERLLDRTKAFAAAVAQWPEGSEQFVPYPATWYKRGSYDDDPSAWERHDPNHKPATRINYTGDWLAGVPGIDQPGSN